MYPFVIDLWPADHTSILTLCSLTIKSSVHRRIEEKNLPPSSSHFVFRLHLIYISLSCLCESLSKCHTTSCGFALGCPMVHYIVSSWTHLGILHIHYISYISSYLMAKKGLTSSHSFLYFAGLSSDLQCPTCPCALCMDCSDSVQTLCRLCMN